jgi:hypothetical protein
VGGLKSFELPRGWGSVLDDKGGNFVTWKLRFDEVIAGFGLSAVFRDNLDAPLTWSPVHLRDAATRLLLRAVCDAQLRSATTHTAQFANKHPLRLFQYLEKKFSTSATGRKHEIESRFRGLTCLTVSAIGTYLQQVDDIWTEMKLAGVSDVSQGRIIEKVIFDLRPHRDVSALCAIAYERVHGDHNAIDFTALQAMILSWLSGNNDSNKTTVPPFGQGSGLGDGSAPDSGGPAPMVMFADAMALAFKQFQISGMASGKSRSTHTGSGGETGANGSGSARTSAGGGHGRSGRGGGRGGGRGDRSRSPSPARTHDTAKNTMVCHGCGGKGHSIKVCPTKPADQKQDRD